MNIQPIEATDVRLSPRKDFGTIKQFKRSLSIRKTDHEVSDTIRVNLSSLTFRPQQSNEIKAKRVKKISELRNIHECLKKVFNEMNKKVVLVDGCKLKVIPNKDTSDNVEINQAVIHFIYQKILRGMTSNIYYFLDDRGYPVTLKEIDKLAQKKYSDVQDSLKDIVESELVDYYDEKSMFLWGDTVGNETEFISLISDLPCLKNEESEKASENENLCQAIFQRMYPLRAVTNDLSREFPVMSPITFLCSYKKFVTTENLFEQALRAVTLSEEEMPYVQKLRVLNLVRVWLDSHLFQDEPITRHMKGTIGKILAIGFVSEKQEFKDLCHEIFFLLEEYEMSCFLPEKFSPSKIPCRVENILCVDQSKIPNYINLLHGLADDFKYLAAESVATTTKTSLFKEKGANSAQIFYNQIVSFGVAAFIKTFEPLLNSQPDAKGIKHKLDHFFTNFIDLAHELVKRHDYLSSCAIYNLLNLTDLNTLLVVHDKKRNSVSKAKKMTILKSVALEHKLQELEDLFSVDRNFEVLRKKMKECQDSHLFFVPQFAPTKNEILHKLEKIEASFVNEPFQKINNEKLHMISDMEWGINELLQQVRGHLKDRQISVNTDIPRHLGDEYFNEEKLNEISKKIKHILGKREGV